MALALELLLDDQIRRGERGRDVALLNRPFSGDVGARVRMQPGRRVAHCQQRVEHRLERFIPAGDQLGRILGAIARVGDHDRDRLAHVAHDLARQDRLEQALHPRARVHAHGDRPQIGGQIGRGDHIDHPGMRPGQAGVDRADTGVGMGAAHDAGAERPRAPEVVDEPARAREQPPVLLAGQRTADGRSAFRGRARPGSDRTVCDHGGQFLQPATPARAHPPQHGHGDYHTGSAGGESTPRARAFQPRPLSHEGRRTWHMCRRRRG